MQEKIKVKAKETKFHIKKGKVYEVSDGPCSASEAQIHCTSGQYIKLKGLPDFWFNFNLFEIIS